MLLLRFLLNGLILAAEMAAIAGIAYSAWREPLLFAVLTGLMAFGVGAMLDIARLRHEMPFYFDRAAGRGTLAAILLGLFAATAKGLLAGVVALITFSGTDTDRLLWVAIVFGVTIFAGTSLIRTLSVRLGARPLRWGFFRLAAPLGLLFATGMAVLAASGLLPASDLAALGRKAIIETPERPSVAQASELLFLVKQYFDQIIVTILETFLSPDWARAVAVVVSVNVLTGFAAGVWAVIVAEGVRRLEEAGSPAREPRR